MEMGWAGGRFGVCSVMETGTRGRKMLIEAGNVLSDRLTKARWMDDVSTTYKQAAFTNRSALSFTGHFDDAFLRQASFKFIQRLPFAGSVSYRR